MAQRQTIAATMKVLKLISPHVESLKRNAVTASGIAASLEYEAKLVAAVRVIQ